MYYYKFGDFNLLLHYKILVTHHFANLFIFPFKPLKHLITIETVAARMCAKFQIFHKFHTHTHTHMPAAHPI